MSLYICGIKFAILFFTHGHSSRSKEQQRKRVSLIFEFCSHKSKRENNNILMKVCFGIYNSLGWSHNFTQTCIPATYCIYTHMYAVRNVRSLLHELLLFMWFYTHNFFFVSFHIRRVQWFRMTFAAMDPMQTFMSTQKYLYTDTHTLSRQISNNVCTEHKYTCVSCLLFNQTFSALHTKKM